MVKILLLLPEISKIVKEDVKHGHSSKTPHKTTPSPPPKSSPSTQASPRWTWPCKCKIKIKTILAFGIYQISSRINNNLAKLMLKITEAVTTATSKKDSWRKTSATSTRINRSQVIMRGTILRDHIFRRICNRQIDRDPPDRIRQTNQILQLNTELISNSVHL